METFYTFFRSDFGSLAAARAAARSYFLAVSMERASLIAAVDHPSFGRGYEVWSVTTTDPTVSRSFRAFPGGVSVPTSPSALVRVIDTGMAA